MKGTVARQKTAMQSIVRQSGIALCGTTQNHMVTHPNTVDNKHDTEEARETRGDSDCRTPRKSCRLNCAVYNRLEYRGDSADREGSEIDMI